MRERGNEEMQECGNAKCGNAGMQQFENAETLKYEKGELTNMESIREQKPFIERAGRRMSVGRQGEKLAASHLELAGYEILRRNFTCRLGEIDVIARPRGENILCFIEVKCRRDERMGRPYESVGGRKQRHYRQVATVFLMREWESLRLDSATEYRFDVMEVVLNAGKPSINHIKGAFV
jgi:putative endonuclease